jgi:hypothetical protein
MRKSYFLPKTAKRYLMPSSVFYPFPTKEKYGPIFSVRRYPMWNEQIHKRILGRYRDIVEINEFVELSGIAVSMSDVESHFPLEDVHTIKEDKFLDNLLIVLEEKYGYIM